MPCLFVQKSVYMPVNVCGCRYIFTMAMYGAQRTTSGVSTFSIVRQGLLFKNIHQFCWPVNVQWVLGLCARYCLWLYMGSSNQMQVLTQSPPLSMTSNCWWKGRKEPHACRKVSVSSCHYLPWHSAPKYKWVLSPLGVPSGTHWVRICHSHHTPLLGSCWRKHLLEAP